MPTVTEPVYDIGTGEQTGTITVEVLTAQQAADYTAAEAAKEANGLTLRGQADAALVDLRTERDRSYAGLTPTQALTLLVPAVKLCIRVQIGVIRLLLNRVDGID